MIEWATGLYWSLVGVDAEDSNGMPPTIAHLIFMKIGLLSLGWLLLSEGFSCFCVIGIPKWSQFSRSSVSFCSPVSSQRKLISRAGNEPLYQRGSPDGLDTICVCSLPKSRVALSHPLGSLGAIPLGLRSHFHVDSSHVVATCSLSAHFGEDCGPRTRSLGLLLLGQMGHRHRFQSRLVPFSICMPSAGVQAHSNRIIVA